MRTGNVLYGVKSAKRSWQAWNAEKSSFTVTLPKNEVVLEARALLKAWLSVALKDHYSVVEDVILAHGRVDFWIPKKQVAVRISRPTDAEDAAVRSVALAREGYRPIAVTADEVLKDPELVYRRIARSLGLFAKKPIMKHPRKPCPTLSR